MNEHPEQDLPFDFVKLTSYVNANIPHSIKFTIPLKKNTDMISIIGSLDVLKPEPKQLSLMESHPRP